jgi:hypothetical protein
VTDREGVVCKIKSLKLGEDDRKLKNSASDSREVLDELEGPAENNGSFPVSDNGTLISIPPTW